MTSVSIERWEAHRRRLINVGRSAFLAVAPESLCRWLDRNWKVDRDEIAASQLHRLIAELDFQSSTRRTMTAISRPHSRPRKGLRQDQQCQGHRQRSSWSYPHS